MISVLWLGEFCSRCCPRYVSIVVTDDLYMAPEQPFPLSSALGSMWELGNAPMGKMSRGNAGVTVSIA